MNENIISESVIALIEAMGMQAENQNRIQRGESLAYTEDSFLKVNDRLREKLTYIQTINK